MFCYVGNAAVQWLFVGSGPCSAGEVLSQLAYFFRFQKTMNLHATKSVLETLVTSLPLLAPECTLLELLNDFIVDTLPVVVGDASVWTNEFQQVAKGRTIAEWEAPEAFPRHGFTQRQWATITGQFNAGCEQNHRRVPLDG